MQVPAAGEGEAGTLPEQELGSVDSQELRGIARKGNYEAMVPLGEDHSDHVRSIIIPGLMQLPNPPHVEHGGIPGDMSCSPPALFLHCFFPGIWAVHGSPRRDLL